MVVVLLRQERALTLMASVITKVEQKFRLKRLTTGLLVVSLPHPATNLLVSEKVIRPTHPPILLVATLTLALEMSRAPRLPLSPTLTLGASTLLVHLLE